MQGFTVGGIRIVSGGRELIMTTWRLNILLCLAFLLATFAALQSQADEPRSSGKAARAKRLQRLLQRFPDADTNGDGVLSPAEALAYRDKVSPKGKEKSKEAAARPGSNPPPTFEDVSYGPHERNVLDLWQAKSETPAPLVVFIHGGGFINGDKSKIRSNAAVRTCLAQGVSFASINYRFREHAAIPEILRDAARAIQFIRSRAKEWNIDPDRIAAYGGSAGAGTSLWLAVHDDLAEPSSDDPIRRQSSRLAAAGMLNGQASYDLRDWEKVIGPAPYKRSDAEFLQFYGFASLSDAEKSEADARMKDCSMISLITADDPPIVAACSLPDGDFKDRGHYVHHPKHATAIGEKCKQERVECLVLLNEGGTEGNHEKEVVNFLIEKLKKAETDQ